jgi:hypothetical protein
MPMCDTGWHARMRRYRWLLRVGLLQHVAVQREPSALDLNPVRLREVHWIANVDYALWRAVG